MPSATHKWAVLLLVGATAACHPKPPATTPTQTAPVSPAAPAAPPAPAPRPPEAARQPAPVPSEADLFLRKSLAELNAEHPLSDVFFELDQNAIRESERRALQADAAWLTKWPSVKVRIDGHCDERGTAEYNLALGDRRADATRAYLVSLGVRADRIEVRSLGKESPFCGGEGESCWSQNRRGHFEITGK